MKFKMIDCMSEKEFLKESKFNTLIEFNISGRDDITYLYIGKIENDLCWYKCSDFMVYSTDFGYIDG